MPEPVTPTQEPASPVDTFPFARPDLLHPPVELARLRATAPACRLRDDAGAPLWLVTGFDDVRTVLGERCTHIHFGDSASLFEEPAAQRRARTAMGGTFTLRRAEAMAPRVETVAAAMMDELLARPRPADLLSGLARGLPIVVICELLGVPVADRREFTRWADLLTAVTSATSAEQSEAVGRMHGYLGDLVADRRASPRDDLVSALLAAEPEGVRLSVDDVVGLTLALVIAGYVTSTNAIVLGVIDMVEHGQMERLRREPDLLEAATEEVLRTQSGRNGETLRRVATRDLDVSGVRIPAGEGVMCSLEAANRAPERYPDPDRVDIGRGSPPAHLAFGHGAHRCPGAALARVELRVALGQIARRMPGLRLAVPVDRLARETNMFGDDVPVELPVHWDAAS